MTYQLHVHNDDGVEVSLRERRTFAEIQNDLRHVGVLGPDTFIYIEQTTNGVVDVCFAGYASDAYAN
jgi:hypothetical protein